MDYSILPPELLILLAFKLNVKRYKSNSASQIFYPFYASQSDPGAKHYYFQIKKEK